MAKIDENIAFSTNFWLFRNCYAGKYRCFPILNQYLGHDTSFKIIKSPISRNLWGDTSQTLFSLILHGFGPKNLDFSDKNYLWSCLERINQFGMVSGGSSTQGAKWAKISEKIDFWLNIPKIAKKSTKLMTMSYFLS